MMLAAGAATGQPWVQVVLSVVGVLGGTGGIAAVTTVVLQRRKFKADAADVITDTALTLVEPLKARVRELETEATGARKETASAHREATAARQQVQAARLDVADLRTAVAELTSMMRRWRSAIMAPDATVEHLRVLVSTEPGAVNGHGPGG